MPLPPWVIDELQQERARREEEDRVRSRRIELPQTDGIADEESTADQARAVPCGVVVVRISPPNDGCIDV
jgi:hypothetical protein